jgi:hypothetical protein
MPETYHRLQAECGRHNLGQRAALDRGGHNSRLCAADNIGHDGPDFLG